MIRIEDVRLPELSPTASEADRRLLQALYDQFRDTNQRLWALESTLGIAPRKASSLVNGTVTAVSVTTANGVSGSSSGGATPALTLALAAITPTTVAATDATDASSSTAAAVKTAGGLAVAKKAYVGTDLNVGADVYANQLANGQGIALKSLTEELTIAAAVSTNTTIAFPAGSIGLGVSVRVTAAIPTASAFSVGDVYNAAPTQFSVAVSSAANTTKACVGSSGTSGAWAYPSASAVSITPDAPPANNTGRVRVTIHYISVTPPTS